MVVERRIHQNNHYNNSSAPRIKVSTKLYDIFKYSHFGKKEYINVQIAPLISRNIFCLKMKLPWFCYVMLEFVFLGGKCSDMHPTNLHIKLLKTILKQQAMLKGNISCWDQHIKEESLRFFPRYFRNSILSDTNLKLISNEDEKIFEVIYLTFITYSNVVHTSLLVRITKW